MQTSELYAPPAITTSYCHVERASRVETSPRSGIHLKHRFTKLLPITEGSFRYGRKTHPPVRMTTGLWLRRAVHKSLKLIRFSCSAAERNALPRSFPHSLPLSFTKSSVQQFHESTVHLLVAAFTTASAHFSPSIAADTMPPA